MPRAQINNPTDRMQRVLSDVEELEAWADHLHTTIQATTPELLPDLPNKPYIAAILQERTRQELTYTRTVAKRKYMQRVRTASDELGSSATSMKHVAEHTHRRHGLTPAHKAEIERILAEEPAQLPDGTDLQPPVNAVLATEHALQQEIGLPVGVEIEPDPETENLERDLAEGKLFG